LFGIFYGHGMLAYQRRTKILDLIREEGTVRVTALSDIFSVSEVTIRQDLEKLADDGLVEREHGGAHLGEISQQVSSLTLQHRENMPQKESIGKAAAAMVTNATSIILDAGSTTTEIARHLNGFEQLTVVTNALNIALLLGSRGGISTLMTGGEFKAPTLSLTGEKAGAFFSNVNADTVFLATAGVDARAGLTYPGFADIPVKSAMIKAAQRVVLVADSSKIGKKSLATLGPVSLVHTLITDNGISESDRNSLRKAGVEVVVAGKHASTGQS
jgi:DeoR/GlpR family transcriptional regulator of sugar metabolism